MIGYLLAALAVCAVLVVPGLPLIGVLRMRLLPSAALIAPASITIITIAAEIGARAGIGWSPWIVLIVGIAAALPLIIVKAAGRILADALARRRRRSARHLVTLGGTEPGRTERGADTIGGAPRTARALARLRGDLRPNWPILAGLGVGAGSILVVSRVMMGGVSAISQTYDGIFHLNAVRYILRSHDASAWHIGGMTLLPGQESYYPAAWHQTASLVALVGGQSLPLSCNLLMLAIAAIVWPLGLMALVSTSTGAGRLGIGLAGAFAGISLAFPFALISFGILLPTFLTTALLPALLLLLIQTLRIAGPLDQRLPPLALAVLIPTTVVAIASAQPQGVFGGLSIGAPVILWALVLRVGGLIRSPRRALLPFALTLLAAAATTAIIMAIWTTLRPGRRSSPWGPTAETWQAIANTLSLAPNGTDRLAWLGLFVLGSVLLVASVRGSQGRWLIAALIGGGTISTLGQCLPVGDARYFWTGPWYSDPFRMVALTVVAGIPLLALGIDTLARVLLGWARTREGASTRRVARTAIPSRLAQTAVAAAVIGVLLTSFASSGYRQKLDEYAGYWHPGPLLSWDERELLEELPEVVPPDAIIATNAWNGSSLAYAISDRQVLNKTGSFKAYPDVHLLNAKLDEARTDPAVCDAAHELDVDYALDFGPEEIWDKHATYTGLNEISETGSATLVLRKGEASLWKMKPCRGTDGVVRGF